MFEYILLEKILVGNKGPLNSLSLNHLICKIGIIKYTA